MLMCETCHFLSSTKKKCHFLIIIKCDKIKCIPVLNKINGIMFSNYRKNNCLTFEKFINIKNIKGNTHLRIKSNLTFIRN